MPNDLQGLLKHLENDFRSFRINSSPEVQKCKAILDKLGIPYDETHAHISVPHYAGGYENFQWRWVTTTTSKHKSKIDIFDKIVSALEVKNDDVKYESMVAKFDEDTKKALDATVKNITSDKDKLKDDTKSEVYNPLQEEILSNLKSDLKAGLTDKEIAFEYINSFGDESLTNRWMDIVEELEVPLVG